MVQRYDGMPLSEVDDEDLRDMLRMAAGRQTAYTREDLIDELRYRARIREQKSIC